MISAFCNENGIRLRQNVPLSELTTFRIGGPSDYAVYPSSVQQMAALIAHLKKEQIRFFVLGRGSDILAKDEGYRGVIVLSADMKDLSCDDQGRITAGAGCSMASVANLALKNSLAGLEFLHGIPGSMGGGIFMNAGAYGSEIGTFVTSVTWVDAEGKIHVSDRESMEFSYRHSYFTHNFGVVCQATLQCQRGDYDSILTLMRDLDRRRREKQPLEYPSAGSTFKRPEGYFAGKLIEDCGLKGFTVGGACVSEKHAGFVINKQGATERDVRRLIDAVTEIVKEKTGVALEPEVRFLED